MAFGSFFLPFFIFGLHIRGGVSSIEIVIRGRHVVGWGVVGVVVTDGPNTVGLSPAALGSAAGSPVGLACPLFLALQEDGLMAVHAIISTVPIVAVGPTKSQSPNAIAIARQDASLVCTCSTQAVVGPKQSHITTRIVHGSFIVGDGDCLRRGLEGVR
jgi:hypothetical protein